MGWTLHVSGSGPKDVSSIVSTGTVIGERQDASLDKGSLTLFPVSNESPIDPSKSTLEYSEGSESKWFRVVSDSVEVVQRGPTPAYRHTVQYVSLARELAFHLAKGMDFTQPKLGGEQRCDYNALYGYAMGHTAPSGYVGSYSSTVNLNPKAKIGMAYVSVSFYFMDGSAHTLNHTSSYHLTGVEVRSNGTALFTVAASNDGDKVYLTESQIAQISGLPSISIFALFGGYISEDESNKYVQYVLINCKLVSFSFYYLVSDVIEQVVRGCSIPSDSMYASAPLATLPASGDFHDFVYGTAAQDFQFTQGETLWDCLSEVYDSFDAQPTIDQNGVLGVKYYNERNAVTDYASRQIDAGSTLSDEGRADGLVCRYQNAVPPTSVYYPSKTGFATARSGDLGVPSASSYEINVSPFRIQIVQELKAKLQEIQLSVAMSPTVRSTAYHFGDDVMLDITDFVFEKAKWSLLDKEVTDRNYPTQYNTFWYQSGGDSIYVGNIDQTLTGSTYSFTHLLLSAAARMFGSAADSATFALIGDGVSMEAVKCYNGSDDEAVYDIPFLLRYIPFMDGAARLESPDRKRDGELLSSQSGGLLSTYKMGLSMLGQSMREGEGQRTKTYSISTFAARPKPGEWFSDPSGDWVVQGTGCTMVGPQEWKCDVQYSKSFNQLSRRIKVDRSVTFTQIVPSLALLSETIYTEYVYVSASNPRFVAASASHVSAAFFQSACFSSIDFSGSYQGQPCDFAVVQTKYLSNGVMAEISPRYMPIAAYALGNMLCLEGGYDSPISSGNMLRQTAGPWFTTNLASIAVPYCNDWGFFDAADVYLAPSQTMYWDLMPVIYTPPAVRSVFIRGMVVEKRPNDVFRLNYELAFLSNPSDADPIIVYPAFVGNSSAVQRVKPGYVRIFMRNASDPPYSAFEGKAYGTEVHASSYFTITESPIGGLIDVGYSATFVDGASLFTFPSACLGWMVADQSGAPLLARNSATSSGSGLTIYGFASHYRL